jgi:chemotaxis protein methyltransferase CheR
LRELPAAWREGAFTREAGTYSLLPEHRRLVEWRLHDVRTPLHARPFHLVLCRNLAFTYFDDSVQNSVGELLRESLAVGGYLVIGEREEMGGRTGHLVRVDRARGLYRLDRPSPQD